MSENKNMRELSMDEMDKVSGGAGECFDCTKIRTEEDLNYYVYTFIASMEKSFGRDATADFIKTQLPSKDVLDEYINAGLDGLHNNLGRKFIDKEYAHR